MNEPSADRAAGESVPITLNGKEYMVSPLKGRHYAKIKAKIRGEALTQIMGNAAIDPITKRHSLALASKQAIPMETVLEEMMAPDTAAWILHMLVQEQDKKITLAMVEDELPVAGLMQMVVGLSGLVGEDEADSKKAEGPQDTTP